MKLKKNPVIYITVAALLIAAAVVLDRFMSINTSILKIGFAFIPPTLAAIMFGPGMGAAVWGLSDLIGALLFPKGMFHPGFTVCAVLMGLISGFLLSSDPINIRREKESGSFIFSISRNRVKFFPNVIVTVLINCLLLGLIVNTFWLSQLSGENTYWAILLKRLVEYAVLVPLQIAIIPLLIKLGEVLKKSLRSLKKRPKNDS